MINKIISCMAILMLVNVLSPVWAAAPAIHNLKNCDIVGNKNPKDHDFVSNSIHSVPLSSDNAKLTLTNGGKVDACFYINEVAKKGQCALNKEYKTDCKKAKGLMIALNVGETCTITVPEKCLSHDANSGISISVIGALSQKGSSKMSIVKQDSLNGIVVYESSK